MILPQQELRRRAWFDTLDSLDNAVGEVFMSAFATKADLDLAIDEVIESLSPAAARFVVDHPVEAKLALRVALETAAQQYSSVPAALRELFVPPSDSDDKELLGAAEAAQRLNVSRATVYNWIDDGRLLAWRVTRQGVVIPAEQIIGPREVVAGIAEVIEVIGDERAAWRFLIDQSPYFDTPMRPLDVLKKGGIKEVLKAASSQGDSFT
jgi:excisionase family DNA binding protein